MLECVKTAFATAKTVDQVENSLEVSMRRGFWFVQAICWLLYAIAAFLLVISPDIRPSVSLFLLKLWRSMLGFLAAFAIYGVTRLTKRSSASIFALPSLALVSCLVLGYLWFIAFRMSANVYFHHLLTDWRFFRYSRDSVEQIAILMTWSVAYAAVTYWQDALTQRTRAEAAAARAQRARWQMLRCQINPHFLFNTLNSVRASIAENSEQARQMVTRLSDYLRYSLGSDERELVSLKEEIAVVSDYLSIEQTRFEKRLQVAYAVQPAVETLMVPRFLLQPLAENAIKHGMVTSPLPLRIEIRAKLEDGTLQVEVENSGNWLPLKPTDGRGLGIRNLRERLEVLYGRGHDLTITSKDGKVSVRVSLELGRKAHEGPI